MSIIVTMLAQPVWAISNGEIFQQCKPFASNGYTIEGMTSNQRMTSLACNSFFSGIIHHAQMICISSPDEKHRSAFGTSITSPKVLIQKFLNWAEANPQDWDTNVVPSYWLMNTCQK